MDYQHKTKEDLIQELIELQQKYNSLKELQESEISQNKPSERLLSQKGVEKEEQKVATLYQNETLLPSNTEDPLSKETVEEQAKTYQMLFESINDAVLVFEVKDDGSPGNFIKVNDIACKRYGYSHDEFLTKTPYDLNSEKSKLLVAGIIHKILEEKQAVFELEHVSREGRLIPVEISTRVAKFGNKTILHSIVRDITERKRAEFLIRQKSEEIENQNKEYLQLNEELIQTNKELLFSKERLAESEEMYQMLYESIGDAVFVTDLNDDGTLGTFFMVNDVACQRLGYTYEELLKKSPSDIISEKSKQTLDVRIDKILANKRHSIVETEHVTKYGKIIPVELSTSAAKFRNKTVLYSIGRDITERKQAEFILKEKTEEIEAQNEEYQQINEELKQLNEALEIAKEQAEEKEETYRVLYNSLSDALFVTELQDDGRLSKFILVNDIACSSLGYTREELLSKSPADINSERTREILGLSVQKILYENTKIVEAEHVTKDGRIIPVEISSNYIKLKNRTIFNAIARDISERKHAERLLQEKTDEIEAQNEEYLQINEELNQTNKALELAKEKAEESEETYRMLFDSINDAVHIFELYENGKASNFIKVNHIACERLGYTQEEFLEMSPLNIISDKSRLLISDIIKKIKEKRQLIFELEHVAKDGRVIPVEINSCITNFKNKTYIHSIARDITERKHAELLLKEKAEEIEVQNEEYLQINEELIQTNSELIKAKEKAEESDRLKTAFLQNLSHEIRTPMNAIMGFSSLLIGAYNNKVKLEEFSNIIAQRCSDLLDIVNDLLDIAKIESGLLPLNEDDIALSSLFSELSTFFAEYQKRINKQHINFVIQPNCLFSSLIIKTDSVKLRQILINLITNAFKFTDEGEVNVGCELRKDGRIEFHISDTGIGIPADKHQVIFERFAQLNQKPNKLISGTGLGLSIVNGLLKLLDGQISLTSQPGIGSKFSFSIPFNPSIIQEKKPAEMENRDKYFFHGKLILVVEDDYYNAAFLKEILTQAGAKVFHTEYGNEAVQVSLKEPIDLVLMDIRLPDIDGYEATRQIRQNKPLLKIIAQTAYASHDEKQKSLNAGCSDYISKPTYRDKLLIMIKKHLSKPNI